MDELEQKAKELKRDYFRKYREKNRDRIRETTNNYWIRKAKEELDQTKK